MKYAFVIAFLIFCLAARAQQVSQLTGELETDKYYPESSFLKSKKIKFIIGTSKYSQNVLAYDRSGRLIGDFPRLADTLVYIPFVYEKHGDSLLRLKYNTQHQLYSREMFVYNKNKKIVSYQECRNYMSTEAAVTNDVFYYTPNGAVEAIFHYYGKYKAVFAENTYLPINELKISDAIYYSTTVQKNGTKLVAGRHAIGKPDWLATDTTVFDAKNRILHFNSFAKTAALGCPVGTNVNRVTEYRYTDTSLAIIGYTSHFLDPVPEKDTVTIIFGAGRLRKAEYHSSKSVAKQLTNEYSYVFY